MNPESTTPSDNVELPDGAVELIGGVAVDANGAAIAGVEDAAEQPTETTQSQPQTATDEAEVEETESSTEPELEVEELSSEDRKLIDWAKNKGIEAEDASPTTLKALRLAQESERNFHAGRQQVSELNKALESVQFNYGQQYQPPQMQQQVQYDEYGQPYYPEPTAPTPPVPQGPDPRDIKIAMLDFKVSHPEYQQGSDLDRKMGEIVGQNPLFWMNNLDQAYQIAQTQLVTGDLDAKLEAAREEGRKLEREKLAQKAALAAPKAQATASVQAANDFRTITPQNVQAFVASATTDQYAKRIDEVNRALASL